MTRIPPQSLMPLLRQLSAGLLAHHILGVPIRPVGVGLLAAFSSCVSVRGHAVSGFNGLDAVCKRLFQNAPADGTEHDAEQEPLQILALAYYGHVNLCVAFGPPSEGVSVAGSASPSVRVGRREDGVVRIGPVVVQAFPDAAGAFGDVGRRAAALMHLEVPVCAVAKEL